MPITDADCALLCDAIYARPGGPAANWEHLDPGADDGVCWGLARVLNRDTTIFDVVVFRGSADFQDWFRNLIALANPFGHHALGPVHPGFLLGLEHAWEEIKPMLEYPAIVTGHSLGAARASILCGLMAIDGVTPARRVCFGEPKPGFQPLADLLAKFPGVTYRNGDEAGHDLVTDFPLSFPPEEYKPSGEIVRVSAPPQKDDPLGIFAYHHAGLYREGVLGLRGQS